MSEHLRYASGQSSLGPIIAARSDEGFVALEFCARPADFLARLHARIPGAVVTQDQLALSDMVDALSAIVDQPGRPHHLSLDERGTEHERRVWALLRQIPAGCTTHYGAIAASLGTRDAREATEAIASNPIAVLIPCHRVVKKDGSISGYRWGVARKRALLRREQQATEFTLTA
jgi:AraC family transcriptional regulator of adaptative response/methylated-DNA-[protein]-cysteine methyltransferase